MLQRKAEKEKKERELQRTKTSIAHRFKVAGMAGDNADDFAKAIMKDDDDSAMNSLERSQSLEGIKRSKKNQDLDEDSLIKTDDDALESSSSDSDHFDGLEGTYNLQSTYFDVFDNLMRKYVGDLNTRDELQRKLTKELGKQSIFLY